MKKSLKQLSEEARGLVDAFVDEVMKRDHDNVIVGTALVELTALWVVRVNAMRGDGPPAIEDNEVLYHFTQKVKGMAQAVRNENAQVSDETLMKAELRAAMKRVESLPERKPKVKSQTPWGWK